MGSHNPIEIEIQWKCSHCGNAYGQALTVCMPGAGGSGEPKLLGSGSLVCQHCGQMGPMQIGCALILGMSVMAGSDGAVHMPRPAATQQTEADHWAMRMRYPSRN